MTNSYKKNTILRLEIMRKFNDFYKIKIIRGKETTKIAFSPNTKILVFIENNSLAEFLKKNEYQLRKMLHNKKKETFFPGFKLKFVIKDEKQVKLFNNLENIIVLDRTDGKYNSYALSKGIEPIFKIYTDGSYYTHLQKGGYTAILKNLNGKLDIVWGQVNKKISSTLIELMAAIKGLEKISNQKIVKIRIITDSRYVIKGLTEWIENWKLNDWHTVQGQKVKNIEFWQKFDQLTKGKYIEFQWIKGHSNHFENSLCDKYAREAAEKTNNLIPNSHEDI